MIACDCHVCKSTDPRDKRNRTSALITVGSQNILIDATPELRLGCLANNITRLDAVLITHTHADHIFGLDDVRRFNQVQGQPINIYAYADHIRIIDRVFGYARADRATGNPNLPQFIFNQIDMQNPEGIPICSQKILPLTLLHGKDITLGYRIGPLAYCTDLSEMPQETIEKLQDLDTLVLGALRPRPHATHLTFDQAIELSQKINPKRTYFVHMAHDVKHAEYETLLPPSIQLAYDGLKITIN